VYEGVQIKRCPKSLRTSTYGNWYSFMILSGLYAYGMGWEF
jgi:hypothetical protein